MSYRKKRAGDEKGFTLIEMAVTVAIASILMAIAIAGYLSWKPGYVFRDAVSEVRGGLERAKMRAVETRKECKVVFDATGFEIQDGNHVMNSDAWGNVDSNGVHTAGTPFRTVTLDDFPQITVALGSQPEVIFSPRGIVNIPSGGTAFDSILVSHPNAGDADISVTIAGNINIDWP